MAVACDDDPTLTVLEKVNFTSTPTSSTTDVVVTDENLEDKLVTFTWGAVQYPIAAPVTYSVEFANPQDTLDGWKTRLKKKWVRTY